MLLVRNLLVSGEQAASLVVCVADTKHPDFLLLCIVRYSRGLRQYTAGCADVFTPLHGTLPCAFLPGPFIDTIDTVSESELPEFISARKEVLNCREIKVSR